MAQLANFVLETCNAPGVASTINLAGPPAGRRSFASAFSSGATVYYFLDDGTQAEWGYGAFTAGSPNTLQRQTVIGNTAGNTTLLNFTGTVRVYCDCPAERLATADTVGYSVVFDAVVPSGNGTSFPVPIPATAAWVELEYDLTNDGSFSSTGAMGVALSYDGGSTYKGVGDGTNPYVWEVTSRAGNASGTTGIASITPALGVTYAGSVKLSTHSMLMLTRAVSLSSGFGPISSTGAATISLGGRPTHIRLTAAGGLLLPGGLIRLIAGQ